MTEFLSPAELHVLTGYARATLQAKWLAERRLPHRLDGSRVILSRLHVRDWLEGKEAIVSTGPNWGAINA